MTSITIYTGLSLAAEQAAALLPGARVEGPVQRGALSGDVAAGVAVVVIIDGRFQHALAVSPGEVLDALRAGVRVYGASSMGALRAAELAPYGMVGHGQIYEWIRAEPCFRDDYLGQVFVPGRGAEASMPYADLRFAVRALAAEGALAADLAAEIDACYRELHFAERDLFQLRLALRQRGVDATAAGAAIERLARAPRQKQLDARGVLARVADDLRLVSERNARILDGQRETRRSSAFDMPADMGFQIKI